MVQKLKGSPLLPKGGIAANVIEWMLLKSHCKKVTGKEATGNKVTIMRTKKK